MNWTHKRTAFGLIAMLGVSACQNSACDYTPASNRTTAADQMVTCVNSMPVTPTANMPTSGSATYTGFMVGDIQPASGPSDAIIGDTSLTASFAGGGSVSGTVSNVASSTNGALTGNLAISGGSIVGNLALGTSISGTLTGYGAESVTISGNLAGGFVGDNADGILLGTGLGSAATATFSSSPAGTANLSVFGLK